MGIHWSSFVRWLAWVPNVAVITALMAIGWWGHTYHWTIPKFSTLVGDNSADKSTPAAPEPEALTVTAEKPIVDGAEVKDPFDELPSIEFDSSEAAKNCGVTTGVAEARPTDEVIAAHGVVTYDPLRLAQLAVRTSGIVWRVEKRTGDFVQKGDVLVVVDSAEVGDAKANLIEAAAVYKLKVQDLSLLENVEGMVPARQIREAAAAKEVAHARLFNAHQKLVNLGFSLELDKIIELSVRELADHLHLLGLPSSLAGETASANLIPLVAPLTGVVTHCELVNGETVEPYQVHYVVADTTQMAIQLDVRQEDAARLRIGATVKFNESDVRTVAGKLSWIGTEIDAKTRTVQARAIVANPTIDDGTMVSNTVGVRPPQRLLKANAFGDVSILVNQNPSVVVVPNGSLNWQWEIEQHVVFVPSEEGRRFTPRIVRAGQTKDQLVEVLDGLSAGDQIVTAGSRILSSELSQRLQQRIGDNAGAVRDFGDAKSTSVADSGRRPST